MPNQCRMCKPQLRRMCRRRKLRKSRCNIKEQFLKKTCSPKSKHMLLECKSQKQNFGELTTKKVAIGA